MITAYFGNDICSLCQRKCQADGCSLVVVCKQCKKDKANSLQTAASLLNDIQESAKKVANECSTCNRCYESEDTFAVVVEDQSKFSKSVSGNFFSKTSKKNQQSLLLPLANCVCIDCPNLYRRHRLREQGIESQGTWDALVRDN
jgi:hypothetical protein